MNKLLTATVLIGGVALLLSCVQRRSERPPLIVNVRADGEQCRVSVAGKQVTSDELMTIARGDWERGGIVIYDAETSFKCVGAAAFTLQRAGMVSVEAALRNPA